MQSLKGALLKANVISSKDIERVERQVRIEREQGRKRRERKKANLENEKRERLIKLCTEWIQRKHAAPEHAAKIVAREVIEEFSSKEIHELSFKELKQWETTAEKLNRRETA